MRTVTLASTGTLAEVFLAAFFLAVAFFGGVLLSGFLRR
jgi:hypothetical protein